MWVSWFQLALVWEIYFGSHTSLRVFLSRNGIHGFEGQTPGVKRYITAIFITNNGIEGRKVSLYKPEAKGKGGDSRIWISGLNKLANPNNLLALIAVKRKLFIMNCPQLKSIGETLSISSKVRLVIE